MKSEDVAPSGHPPTHPAPTRRRLSAALHFHHWRGPLGRARLSTGMVLFVVLLLSGLSLAPLLAQQTSTTDTNGPGGMVPALTNWVVAPPATTASNAVVRPIAVTNAPPALSGGAVRGIFTDVGQGKFSVAGRVLRLPAPEAAPATGTTSTWHRAIDFGMNMSKGNSDTLRYSLGMNAIRERDEDLASIRARGVYGESSGTKDTENASARARYERMLSKRTYGLGYAEWLTDPIADTDYRVTAIVSPGWHLMRTDRTILNVEAGAGYLDERKGDLDDGFAAGRLAASAERLLNTHVLAWSVVEYIPKFSDRNVFFVNSEAGVASMLARNLTLNVCVADRYDNAPAIDTKGNDLNLTASLNLCF